MAKLKSEFEVVY